MRSTHPVPVPFHALPSLQLPLFSSYVRAGFPNPADDHLEQRIDLKALVTPPPDASFLLRVAGESMVDAGMSPDDVVVIDRSLEVQQRDVVVAEVEGEFTIQRFLRQNGCIILAPGPRSQHPRSITGARKEPAMPETTFRYPILICWDEDVQAYIADVPDLPTCTGSGDTYEAALASVLEALQWRQERTHRTQQSVLPRPTNQSKPG